MTPASGESRVKCQSGPLPRGVHCGTPDSGESHRNTGNGSILEGRLAALREGQEALTGSARSLGPQTCFDCKQSDPNTLVKLQTFLLFGFLREACSGRPRLVLLVRSCLFLALAFYCGSFTVMPASGNTRRLETAGIKQPGIPRAVRLDDHELIAGIVLVRVTHPLNMFLPWQGAEPRIVPLFCFILPLFSGKRGHRPWNRLVFGPLGFLVSGPLPPCLAGKTQA